MKVYIVIKKYFDDFSYIEKPYKVFLNEMEALEWQRNKVGYYYIDMEVE